MSARLWNRRGARHSFTLACYHGKAIRAAWNSIAVLIAVGIGGPASAGPSCAEPQAQLRFRNTAPEVAYIGSRACKLCHPDIYAAYRRTAMGRSMSLPSEPDQLAKVPRPITTHAQQFGSAFEVSRKGTDLYQSEYQVDAHGQEVFRSTHRVAFVLGAGDNGISHIVRWRDYLLEAPLSYYSRSGTWELSPGYENRDYGFTRTVTASCMACHSGRARPVPGGQGLYRDPPFSELAIGCETCHGPGTLHVEARMKGTPLAGNGDPTIVNPAHLAGWLADNICMRCHQMGDARILQPNKSYSDFRPGTPLDNTVAIFLVPFTRKFPPKDPLLQHYISMILSKCFTASGERLHCITCHDPHVQPSTADARAQFFRKKCLGCHKETSCSLPLEARLRKSPPDDCADCHMPKQNLRAIAHSALTIHRIVAKPDEPFPETVYHMTTPQLPELVHLDAIPGKESVPTLTVLRAYGEVRETQPAFGSSYDALLDIASLTDPAEPYVLAALGRKKAAQQTPQRRAEAIELLTKAIQAGWTQTSDYALLAGVLADSERVPEAVSVLKRGIRANPFDGGLYRMLAVQEMDLGQGNDAREVIKQGLEIFPQDSLLRGLLKKTRTEVPR